MMNVVKVLVNRNYSVLILDEKDYYYCKKFENINDKSNSIDFITVVATQINDFLVKGNNYVNELDLIQKFEEYLSITPQFLIQISKVYKWKFYVKN